MKTKSAYTQVRCKYNWEVIKMFEDGTELYRSMPNNEYKRIANLKDLIDYTSFTKEVISLTWQDEAYDYIDKCENLMGSDDLHTCMDDGMEQREFIGLCHLIASLTDKPE